MTSVAKESPISLTEVERRLRAHEPRIRVVAHRVMRRVIRRTQDMSASGFQIPTRHAFPIEREILLRYADASELSTVPEPASALPEQVFLIGRPDMGLVRRLEDEEISQLVWRTAFQARLYAALREHGLTAAEVRERLAELGQVEVAEIRSVLTQERRLFPPGTERQLYEAFVTFYFELRFFEPAALPRFFPDLVVSRSSLPALDELLAQEVPARSFYEDARPRELPWQASGAFQRASTYSDQLSGPVMGESAEDIPRRQIPERDRSREAFDAMTLEGEVASRVGNAARAALQYTVASQVAPRGTDPAERHEIDGRVQAELSDLGERLAMLTEGQTEAKGWTRALGPLLAPGSDGRWSQEARLLYDLQKACVEHERKRYKLDVWRWIGSLGKRSVQRPVPNQRLVLQIKYLRSARARLSSAHIDAGERRDLGYLLERAENHLVGRLRHLIQQSLAQTLDKVGLDADHLPEEVAREKLIDELLDQATDRGFLAIGDLRDALSRNDLALDDLTREEFLGDDPLLAADRSLARDLEGIYRPGEVYLRGLQRFSAMAFGTKVGRALTLYLVLPFGGAFVILEGLQHILGPILRYFAGVTLPPLLGWTSLLGLGVVLLGLIHSPVLRTVLYNVGRGLWQATRAIFVDLPRWVARLPGVRQVLASRPAKMAWQLLLEPGGIALILALLIAVMPGVPDMELETLAFIGVGVFVLLNALLNSRYGRDVKEICFDATVRAWLQLRGRIVPGLIRLLLDFFKRMLWAFERVLYWGDEWLRFKQGENAVVFVLKAIGATIWAVVTYIARIYITLLIEPQINPIKHFPVVTVSHKIILPFTLQITAFLAAPFIPLLGPVAASTIAGATVFLLPGVFGFLVWELKENWKLYAANRPEKLRAVAIGDHGESMIQFMRLGFHSGTLPKLFSRLRRAERRGAYRGRWRRSQKLRVELHHVERAIVAFVDREFCALLARTRQFAQAELCAGEVQLGSNRIRVEIQRAERRTPLTLVFEEQAGLLVAGVASLGWVESLDPAERAVLRDALVGLYKRAGVHLVREELERHLPRDCAYDIRDDSVIVWPSDNFEVEIQYRGLGRARVMMPHMAGDGTGRKHGWTQSYDPEGGSAPDLLAPRPDAPALHAKRLRFDRAPVTWQRWVERWVSADPTPLLPEMRVLPLSRRARTMIRPATDGVPV